MDYLYRRDTMHLYNEKTIQLINYGREDCCNLHSWGPGARPCYIIHYVIKGSGYLECDGRRHHIAAGQSFLICPYTIVFYYPDPQDPWEYTWVDFVGKEVPEYLESCAMSTKQPVCPVDASGRLPLLFASLKGLDIYKTDRFQANGILLTILGLYADLFPAKNGHMGTLDDTRLDTALTLIRSNYHHSWFNIEELCKIMHCNRVTLYRLFQNNLQLSPGNYLIRYRIAQACEMLRMNMPVKTASLSCGFTDQFYFSRAFKQQMGMAPSDYRKLKENRQMSLAYKLLSGTME